MRGRIFIAWSGSNALALEVKKKLEGKRYIGVVGGEGGSSGDLFVGRTVLKEINHCNQAIFIVQKKADGSISNNLMFELGYALARFKHNKIHIFYIDVSESEIPSDVKGGWAEFYNTCDGEDIAEKIKEKFLSSQNYIIPEDKMQVIDNYYEVKSKIERYEKDPRCSEYELAQYILFFSQAAYMFNDEEEALATLKNLPDFLRSSGSALSQAISLAVCNMEFFLDIVRLGDVQFLEKSKYINLDRRLKAMESAALSWERDDFARWFLVILYDISNYSRILFAANPKTEAERQKALLEESLEIAGKCLEICDELLGEPSNRHYAELYKAYMYRNRATAQKRLGLDPASVRENSALSYRMRAELWDHYNDVKKLNTHLLESFELEYYLALSEELEFIEDQRERLDSCEECEEYINRVKEKNRERSHFINKIENNILASGGGK